MSVRVRYVLTMYSQYWLDRQSISLRVRSRGAFWTIVVLQGGWWTWATVLATRFHHSHPTFDWSSASFGSAFAVYILLLAGFQLNYLFLYVTSGSKSLAKIKLTVLCF